MTNRLKAYELLVHLTDSTDDWIYDQGILAINGTNDLKDWQYNADIRVTNLIHRGFYRKAKSIPKLPVALVVGFSMGGAVAAVYGLIHNTPRILTLNAPNYFKRSLSLPRDLLALQVILEASERTLHLETIGDIVPRIPLGFTKAGTIKRLPYQNPSGSGVSHLLKHSLGNFEKYFTKSVDSIKNM